MPAHFMHHWADERKGIGLDLPEGTTVLIEDREEGLCLWLKPLTDQPSAIEELAAALEYVARLLRQP